MRLADSVGVLLLDVIGWGHLFGVEMALVCAVMDVTRPRVSGGARPGRPPGPVDGTRGGGRSVCQVKLFGPSRPRAVTPNSLIFRFGSGGFMLHNGQIPLNLTISLQFSSWGGGYLWGHFRIVIHRYLFLKIFKETPSPRSLRSEGRFSGPQRTSPGFRMLPGS